MVKTVLKIDGMMCSMCESHINDVIRRDFEVKKVMSSHKKGLTEIVSEIPLDENKLKSAVCKTGYEVTEITAEPYEKHGFFRKK